MIEESIYAIGSAHVGLTGLLGASPNTRIFPAAEERKHALPVVVYEETDARAIMGIEVDSGWYKRSFNFIARAATAKQAKEVVAQLRAAYQRFHGNSSGHDIDDVEPTGVTDEYYDSDLNCY